MKAKSFQTYLEKRLDKKEIAEIEKLAKLEKNYIKNYLVTLFIMICLTACGQSGSLYLPQPANQSVTNQS